MIHRDETFIDLTSSLKEEDRKRKTNIWRYKVRHFINIITFNLLFKKYR